VNPPARAVRPPLRSRVDRGKAWLHFFFCCLPEQADGVLILPAHIHQPMRKVYITGIGLVTSIGNDIPSVSQSLRELRHGFETYAPFQKADVPVKVVGTIKGYNADSYDCEDWTYPSRFSLKRDILRGMAPHGLYTYCAMLDAIADARKLATGDVSNDDTGLYAASGGSPHLLGHYLHRMNTMGVMRCSPLGIVASIAGTVNFNLVSQFKIKGASTGFRLGLRLVLARGWFRL
jgi:3-oxoacyl-[acyl-carrier-protein] synthase-1